MTSSPVLRRGRVALARGSAVVVLLLSFVDVAHADERTEARKQFRRGMELLEEGQFEPGIEALKAAYALKPHPAVLYNIGMAYVDAGKLQAGIEYLTQYAESSPDDRATVEQTVATLQARIAEIEAEVAARIRAAEETQRVVETEGGGRATSRQIKVLDETAEQITLLAEATESPSLYERADQLRTVANELRTGEIAEPEASPAAVAAEQPTGEEQPGEQPAEGQPTPEGEAGSQAFAAAGVAPPGATDVYESQVVSASRFARSPLDAPNSTTVVTDQDIRLSGLTNIGEVIRRAAGLEVMSITPGNTEVSIRGLNQRLSNKVLVLVDGRSLYLDFLGATLWQSIPVSMEEIERIEIIRGPASAIYGADAVTGIVNIILKKPGEGGSVAAGGYGSHHKGYAGASVRGRMDKLSYKLGGGYKREDNYSLIVDPARVDLIKATEDPLTGLETAHFSADFGYKPAAGWSVGAGSRTSVNTFNFQGISRLRELRTDDSMLTQTYLEIGTPIGVSARVYWNLWQNDLASLSVPVGGVPLSFEGLTSHAVDVEVAYQQELELLVPQAIAMGVGYRFKSIDWVWVQGGREEQHHFSVFIEDTLRIGDMVSVALSGRLDRHPLLPNVEISPRVAVVVRPTENIAVRALAGSAFRSPTFMESYLTVDNSTAIRGVTSFGFGNENLSPERLFSAEVGYAHELGDSISLEANAYFNAVLDQITLTNISRYSMQDYPGFSEGVAGFPVGQVQFENEDAAFQQLGGELGIRYFPLRGLDTYLNYAIHDTSPFDSAVDLGGREADNRTSMHKVNAGVQYRSFFGLDAALDVHWVTEQLWVEQVSDPNTGARFDPFHIPGYVLLNARLGYRLFDDLIELGVVGTNLLNIRHRQHPFGQRLGMRVWGTAAVRF